MAVGVEVLKGIKFLRKNVKTLLNLGLSGSVVAINAKVKSEFFDCPMENHQQYGYLYLIAPCVILYFVNLLVVAKKLTPLPANCKRKAAKGNEIRRIPQCDLTQRFEGVRSTSGMADSVICPRGLLYLRYSRAWSWEAIQFEWRWKTRFGRKDRRKQKHITDRRVVSARRGGFVDLQSKSSEDQGWRWIDSNEEFPSFVLTSYYDYVTNLDHLLKPLKKIVSVQPLYQISCK